MHMDGQPADAFDPKNYAWRVCRGTRWTSKPCSDGTKYVIVLSGPPKPSRKETAFGDGAGNAGVRLTLVLAMTLLITGMAGDRARVPVRGMPFPLCLLIHPMSGREGLRGEGRCLLRSAVHRSPYWYHRCHAESTVFVLRRRTTSRVVQRLTSALNILGRNRTLFGSVHHAQVDAHISPSAAREEKTQDRILRGTGH